jgi:calcineurin-like phosphoesterase family protein
MYFVVLKFTWVQIKHKIGSEMEIHNLEISSSQIKTRNLYFIGDFHIGHKNCDIEKILKHVEMIKKDPAGLVFIMGDLADGRDPDHKFFDYDQVDKQFFGKSFAGKCYSFFYNNIMLPIKDKIVGIHRGNHDKDSEKFAHGFVQEMCQEEDVKYLDYRAMTIINSQNHSSHKHRQSYTIFSHHGCSGGRKIGARFNRIEDVMTGVVADIYAQGHTHLLGVLPTLRHRVSIRYADNSRKRGVALREDTIWLANCGGYLKSYQPGNFSYPEKSAYNPLVTGCAKIELDFWDRSANGCVIQN